MRPVKKYHRKTLVFLLAFVVSGAGIVPGARADKDDPVIVEMFSVPSCTQDALTQKDLLRMAENDPNLLIINCRRTTKDKNNNGDRFGRKFCDERTSGYFKELQLMGISTPMVIVNGYLEATSTDVGSAIRAARSLTKMYSLGIEKENDHLNIDIPEIPGHKNSQGEIFLYAYMPTISARVVRQVAAKAAFDPKERKEVEQGMSVPFVTEKQLRPVKMRPMIGEEHLAHWNGEEMGVSVPLKDLIPLALDDRDVSYVVVLQEGSAYGPILAVGEWRALSDVDYMAKGNKKDFAWASFPKNIRPPYY